MWASHLDALPSRNYHLPCDDHTAVDLLWKKQTLVAAIIAPIAGVISGLAVWLATAQHYGGGVIDVDTTGALLPCMWGTIAAAFVPAILSLLISLLRPQAVDFNWEKFNDIHLIQDDTSSIGEKGQSGTESLHSSRADVPFTPAEERYMHRQSWVSGLIGIFLFLTVWIFWPFFMYAAYYEFSRSFFTGWVVVSTIWAFVALLIFTFLPLWDERKLIKDIVLGLVQGDNKRKEQDTEKIQGTKDEGESSTPTSTDTPPLE